MHFQLSKSSSVFLHFLRGIAAQAVVVGHGLSFFEISTNLAVIQNSAVVIFFVLSGFIIPFTTDSQLRRNPDYDFKSFLIDRGSRIYIAFMPALVFVILIDLLSNFLFPQGYSYTEAFNISTFIGNALMLHGHPFFHHQFVDALTNVAKFPLNWYPDITTFGSARPFWTIAVEWWIYMAFGWIYLKQQRVSTLFVLGIVCIVPLFHLIVIPKGLTVVWCIGFLLYLALSKKNNETTQKTNNLFWSMCFFGLSLIRIVISKDAYDITYAILLSISLYFLLCHLQAKKDKVLEALERPIEFMANYSFSLYLVHYSILDIWSLAFGGGWLSLVASFVISNFVAILMYVLFESRYKRLRAWLKRTFVPNQI